LQTVISATRFHVLFSTLQSAS